MCILWVASLAAAAADAAAASSFEAVATTLPEVAGWGSRLAVHAKCSCASLVRSTQTAERSEHSRYQPHRSPHRVHVLALHNTLALAVNPNSWKVKALQLSATQVTPQCARTGIAQHTSTCSQPKQLEGQALRLSAIHGSPHTGHPAECTSSRMHILALHHHTQALIVQHAK
jgi:hypothetical protein